jgi:transposase
VAFAGVDAPPFQSGAFDAKSRHVSKRGSPHLRRTLFQIASVILQHCDLGNPVFLFMNRKRAEGKHFYVYMVAGTAKFLRIYYARVKAYLTALEAEIPDAA